ncbi:MAG: zinc metallopeptidase [Treponema sp.]|nr:zinc metallopeptidase [Treponema sp.]MCL2252315.1 zinc metallopeptidase [Treponema sp.]
MDYYYLILVVPTLILSMIAQFLVKSTFSKYSKIPSKNGTTGLKAAEILLQSNNINDVGVEAVKGSLTDHYDPSNKKLRLSEPVYNQTSIAAIGVSAHETGHAIQHATRWGPLVLRSTLVPIANIGSSLGPWIAIAGLAIQGSASYGSYAQLIFNIGILLFSGAVLFYVITLPVEFNASNRAIAILRDNNVLDADELKGARKVLNAAAMTYVASALTAIASLLRLILLSKRRR